MITIGVLGLQGAVEEHLNQIKAAGEQAIIVKKPEQLLEIDGLIIPGWRKHHDEEANGSLWIYGADQNFLRR